MLHYRTVNSPTEICMLVGDRSRLVSDTVINILENVAVSFRSFFLRRQHT